MRNSVALVLAFACALGCKSKPKVLSHEEALAETRVRCNAFQRANEAGTLACTELAGHVESIADAFGQVRNEGKVPDDDEKALEACMGALAVHTPRCKDDARFKSAIDRLLAAAMR